MKGRTDRPRTEEIEMRKVIVTTLMSLDGYVAGPDGDVRVLPLDESFSAYNVERMRQADTILLGRTTYVGFRDYWPRVVDDESQPPVEREISSINNTIEKVVVSDSLTPADTGPWADTTRIVKRADAHDVVRELKAGDGGDILMFGSVPVWNDLLAHGLVDELHLMVGNAAIGGGVPAFSAGSERLQLQEIRQLEGSQNVLLRYAVPST
jgi:dihydrofolate reductase